MILVGIDDTDVIGSRGTNQLARLLADHVSAEFRCRRIVRHQLLVDPRVPYTSRNGSASLWFEPTGDSGLEELRAALRAGMQAEFVPGSDPGLCLAGEVPDDVVQFGWACKRELRTQSDAFGIADRHGIPLEGLGGTNDGVVGALAALGLAATGDDGRVVHDADWPGEVGGVRTRSELEAIGVRIRRAETTAAGCESASEVGGTPTNAWDTVDVGRKLRPNLRAGRCVLFVEPTDDGRVRALKLP